MGARGVQGTQKEIVALEQISAPSLTLQGRPGTLGSNAFDMFISEVDEQNLSAAPSSKCVNSMPTHRATLTESSRIHMDRSRSSSSRVAARHATEPYQSGLIARNIGASYRATEG